MTLPQTVFRPYRVVEQAPLARGMFRLVVEAEDPSAPLPSFQAGQWVNVRLLNADGTEWAKAAYSLVNAPARGTQRLELGVKLAGDFTKHMAALAVGDRVEVQGPWGLFQLDPAVRSTVCIAGGIGITPFVSMVREAAVTGQEITIVYSTRTVEEAAYLDELRELATVRPNIHLLCTCTRECPLGWEGAEGRVNDVLLDQLPPADRYLLCGPDAFMDHARALLVARGVDPKQVKQESFG